MYKNGPVDPLGLGPVKRIEADPFPDLRTAECVTSPVLIGL